MSATGGRAGRVRAVLTEAFRPSVIEVHDDSASHAGHSGAAPGGETHMQVRMVSDAFAGQSRVARSRAVHAMLDAEFRSGLHALSLVLRAPGEPG